MSFRRRYSLSLLVVLLLLSLFAGTASAGGPVTGDTHEAGDADEAECCNMADWSQWQKYFTPIVPQTPQMAGNPAGRPIPTIAPSNAVLQAWVNALTPAVSAPTMVTAMPAAASKAQAVAPAAMSPLPEPAMIAHAEEVAKGTNHTTIIGHGPAKTEPASRNQWATGGVLRNDSNTGPFFETFDNFYGQNWRKVPHLWGAYAYRGADSVTFDDEQVVKDEAPYDGGYSLKIAGSVPFEAGVSRTIMVTPNSQVRVRAMYALYDHGGEHGGNTWTYDWAALGVKADDCDAEWVNGPWHGQWLPLEHTVTAGPEGRIMIFLQVISPMPENVNAYFDNVQVWVDGKAYTG